MYISVTLRVSVSKRLHDAMQSIISSGAPKENQSRCTVPWLNQLTVCEKIRSHVDIGTNKNPWSGMGRVRLWHCESNANRFFTYVIRRQAQNFKHIHHSWNAWFGRKSLGISFLHHVPPPYIRAQHPDDQHTKEHPSEHVTYVRERRHEHASIAAFCVQSLSPGVRQTPKMAQKSNHSPKYPRVLHLSIIVC